TESDLTAYSSRRLIVGGPRAGVAELADARDLGSRTERCRGSTPLSCSDGVRIRYPFHTASSVTMKKSLIAFTILLAAALPVMPASADTVHVGGGLKFDEVQVLGI